MNRTLLREEGDEEDENRQEKKKREKEKLQDADKKKRVASKKIDGKKDVYHNAAVAGISKLQPLPGMVETAAVNPDAEGLTSPVDTPPATQAMSPGVKGYQGSIVIPPPPRPVTLQQIAHQQQLRGNWPQQAQVVYVTPHPHQVQLHSQVLPLQYISTPGPHSQQVEGQFVSHPHQQGHFAVAQYAQIVPSPAQVIAGSVQRAPAPPHAAVIRTHSLPSQANTPGDHAAGTQPGWSPQSSASTLPVSSVESTLTSSSVESSDGRSWKDSAKPINNKNKSNDAFSVNSGQWTAFSPVESTMEDTWMDEVDEEHSSSDEDVERSSSPELMGEEGEVLLRAPSLASFAESISSVEEETEDIVWRILPEQREYYTKQFKRLQPAEQGVVKGHKARDFFMKSSLPPEILSKIWHLSDLDKDNALNLDEFCIAMHLVVALRHGLELPSMLPGVLLHTGKEAGVAKTVIQPPQADPNTPQQRAEDEDQEPRKAVSPEHSVTQRTPVRAQDHHQANDIARQPSLSDPPSLEDAADRVPVGKAPDVGQGVPTSPNQSVTAEIARPRATVKPSLLDALPGQLLPPPSGKQAREGWTPTSKVIYQALSCQTEVQSPENLSSPLSSPTPEATPDSPLSSDEERKTPSPPLKMQEEEGVEPLTEELQGEEEVIHRQNKRSGERPRSTGDVKSTPPSESSSSSTPHDEGSQGSASSEGKREPPPPPPRNKKGHSRSSSLDLNKLFAAKAKESRGSPTSSPSSSHSSQNGDAIPAAKSEPTTPRHTTPSDAAAVVQEDGRVQKQEDFADFSVFDEFVEARESAAETTEKKDSSSHPRNHRRSFSLDHGRDTVWSQLPQAAPIEVTSRATQNHEALPRPVPKLKPPSPPTLKQGRKPDKDGEKERKLKTEPPKVVVRPLTKEDKLNARIIDLKEKNVTLSRVNSELQQEFKTVMERRVSLEVKLERLRSSSSQ